MRVWSAVLTLVLTAASCGDDSSPVVAAADGDEQTTDSEETAEPPTGVDGVWQVVEVDRQPAEDGVNMAGLAYLEIANGEINGYLGCNDGGGRIEVSETTILISDFFRTAAGCIPESLMTVEDALWAAIVAGPATYAIPTANQMIWQAGGREVVFERVGAVPTTTWPEPEPRNAVMGLDCDDRWVAEINAVPNVGQPLMEVALEYEPSVVEVEETGPLMNVGRNAEGDVVILIYLHDTAEMDFQIWYCVDG